MTTVTAWGRSDDLVEIDGALEEEWGFYSSDGNETGYLAFSDGTVLSVKYGDGNHGVWRLFPVIEGSAKVERVPAPLDDRDNYSDRVTLTGDLRWVLFSREALHAIKPGGGRRAG